MNKKDNAQIERTLDWLLEFDRKMVGSSDYSDSPSYDNFDSEYESIVDASAESWDRIDQNLNDLIDKSMDSFLDKV